MDRPYIAGEHLVICQRCGFKYLRSETKTEWTGVLVCDYCFEARQPQDFVRAIAENQAVSVARPEAPDTFIVAVPDIPIFELTTDAEKRIWVLPEPSITFTPEDMQSIGVGYHGDLD